MKIKITLNGVPKTIYTEPGENVQELMQRIGIISVRDSDDHQGFAGSDTIILNGKTVNAGLLVASQIDGCDVKTVESLINMRELSPILSAMIDAGVVQDGYNSPAAALMIASLLERTPNPSDDEIKDALSPLFIRDCGYKPFFDAVRLAQKRITNPEAKIVAPEFREDLTHVGKARSKVDGKKLVTGQKAYVEDMVDDGALILKILRSPYAHAYIKSIDTSEAEKMHGVSFVVTYKNCPEAFYTSAGQGFPEPSPYDKRMFSQKLCHIGDRVAGVAGENEEIVNEALKKIKVEYEVLKPVLTIDEAKAPDAPIIHKGFIEYKVGAPENLDNSKADPRDGKIIYQFPIGADPHKNLAASVKGGIGDVEKGFAEADYIIDKTYETTQIQCTPPEHHVVYTRMEGDRLIIHAATQVPWHLRRIVSTILGINENKVRVVKERVGGGYGSKQDILLEEVAAFITWKTGKPVFHKYTREEEFIACSTRKPMRVRVKIGAKKDGKFTAIQMDVESNTTAFGNHSLTVSMNAASKSLPLFLCDNFYFDIKVYYTNLAPTGAYQGYGAPKGSFGLQMAVAELAEQMGVDQIELIEKNRVREGVWLEILRCLGEGREGTPALVKSCGLDGSINEGMKMIDWGKKETSSDPDIKIGKGMAIIQQGSGLPGLDHSCADISLLADGTFMLHSGGADIGTGLDTVSVKVAAEVLRTNMEDVSILSGDTDNTPFDTGAYASSGTYFSGNASKKAAEDLRRKMLETAAKIFEVPVEEVELEYPNIIKCEAKSMTYKELAWHTHTGHGCGQLMGYASFTTEDHAIPYGAHFAQVSVNTKTGYVKIDKFFVLQDCGTPINPEIALGQMYGAALKSIGHSIYEEMIYDENGKCLNANLLDYGPPTIYEMPEVFGAKLIYTDDPYGPFGGKSISEIATNGAAPAIAIAIHDAVGIWLRKWPFSPENVLKALGKI
ncbi:MAG: molybdopterin-dependent oxidoreductase Mo/Fe-S-binding subunit [Alphaproteobacteria bacterium]